MNNTTIYRKLLKLRNHGWGRTRDESLIKGMNSRLDELQAAVLRVKLPFLDRWNEKRTDLASLYDEILNGSGCIVPSFSEHKKHCYHMYVVRTPRRNALRKFLADEGVPTRIHYPVPAHLQKAYINLRYKRGDFPVAEKAAKEIISLPIYPEFRKLDAERVAKGINQFLNRGDVGDKRRSG